MTASPEVSVVMSVYNDDEHLCETMDSVLSQENVDFEFIVVDDGSMDESARILDEYAGIDSRVCVIHQKNAGLTRALIRGCAEARGQYIARQDAGDISLPGRLKKETAQIRQNPDVALVSCGSRFVGPLGEHLYDVMHDPSDATERLLTVDLNSIRGPSHHGCTLFPLALYRKVGGYRPHFYFAQDLDLWVRLAELGKHIIMQEILYQASMTVSAISNLYRKEQIKAAQAIIECSRLRRCGISEDLLLNDAMSIRPAAGRCLGRLDYARALYFVGSCLKEKGDPQAEYYLKQALMKFPLHLKSAARLLFG